MSIFFILKSLFLRYNFYNPGSPSSNLQPATPFPGEPHRVHTLKHNVYRLTWRIEDQLPITPYKFYLIDL